MGDAEAPIGVLGSGAGLRLVASTLRRLLPHEDLVALGDDAYAPWARRPPAVVAARVGRLAGELAGVHGAKLVVLASAAAGPGDLAAAQQAAGGLAVMSLDRAGAHAAAASRGGVTAFAAGEGCVRSRVQGRLLRGQRAGPGGVAMVVWPGLRDLVESGRSEQFDAAAAAAGLVAAGVDSVALACPHACAVAPALRSSLPAGVAVTDAVELAAARVQALLARTGRIARRRRPGRLLAISSDPVRALHRTPPSGGW